MTASGTALLGIGTLVGSEALIVVANNLDEAPGGHWPDTDTQVGVASIVPVMGIAGFLLGYFLLSADWGWYLMAGLSALGLAIVYFVYGIP